MTPYSFNFSAYFGVCFLDLRFPGVVEELMELNRWRKLFLLLDFIVQCVSTEKQTKMTCLYSSLECGVLM